MKESRFQTVRVPQILSPKTPAGDTPGGGGPPGNPRMAPATLVQGFQDRPTRVVVRNISFAAEVFLAHEAAVLQTGEPGADTYFLPAGVADTFMLAPTQKLLAVSLSLDARVSIAISEALPVDTKS